MAQQVPHAVFWLVTIVLVVAAVIDGRQLKVPNWLTFPFALAGLAFSVWYGGGWGLLGSIEGLGLGLALLLPLYAIGGMGAGDVKLLAGVGAWVGPALTAKAFVATAMAGGVMAVAMVAWTGSYVRHWALFQTIVSEILTVRDPVKLSAIAAARKPTMLLLPYGIPIAVGTIAFFAWAGLLI
jgi:prepilin peptidase CpaA